MWKLSHWSYPDAAAAAAGAAADAASAATSAVCTYYVIIGGRFAPPYKYMIKSIQQKQQQKQQQLQQQPQQLQGHFGKFFEKVQPHLAQRHQAFSENPKSMSFNFESSVSSA